MRRWSEPAPALRPPRGEHGPFGHVDEVTSTSEGLRIRGWAIDPDTDRPINVRLLVDGQLREELTADLDRPDVGARHGYGNLHGFDVTLKPVVREGVEYNRRHTSVCVIGVNIGQGRSAQVGCGREQRSVSVLTLNVTGRREQWANDNGVGDEGVMEDLAPTVQPSAGGTVTAGWHGGWRPQEHFPILSRCRRCRPGSGLDSRGLHHDPLAL